MKNNPFSFYDFLGNIIPGMICLFIALYLIYIDHNALFIDYFSIDGFYHLFSIVLKSPQIYLITAFIVASYILGHIISYVSSITVEYFSNQMFGYPSFYLLNKKKGSFKYYFKKYWGKKIYVGYVLWKLITCLILFPVSLFFFLFGHFLKINDYITRSLDQLLIDNIKKKRQNLFVRLKLTINELNNSSNIDNSDTHRIIMHYAYINIPNSDKKMDNYIAIYGFLRAMTFLSCCFTDFMLCKLISTIDFTLSIDGTAIFIMSFLFFLCIILFMSFVKFYRRFTLENFMSLLVEKQNNE